MLSFLAAFDPGDRVALADPSYPAYRNILLALGIEPVSLPAGPETRYQPSIELIERAVARLAPFDDRAGLLADVARFVIERRH